MIILSKHYINLVIYGTISHHIVIKCKFINVNYDGLFQTKQAIKIKNKIDY